MNAMHLEFLTIGRVDSFVGRAVRVPGEDDPFTVVGLTADRLRVTLRAPDGSEVEVPRALEVSDPAADPKDGTPVMGPDPRPGIRSPEYAAAVARIAGHLAAASAHIDEREASFDRCDTDGFLSQWAHGINANEKRLQANVDANGGYARFWTLYDDTGWRVNARVVETRYGSAWMILDDDGNATGTFLRYRPARASTLARKGYMEAMEWAPARAYIAGRGTGLGGQAWASVRRIDPKRNKEA